MFYVYSLRGEQQSSTDAFLLRANETAIGVPRITLMSQSIESVQVKASASTFVKLSTIPSPTAYVVGKD